MWHDIETVWRMNWFNEINKNNILMKVDVETIYFTTGSSDASKSKLSFNSNPNFLSMSFNELILWLEQPYNYL